MVEDTFSSATWITLYLYAYVKYCQELSFEMTKQQLDRNFQPEYILKYINSMTSKQIHLKFIRFALSIIFSATLGSRAR